MKKKYEETLEGCKFIFRVDFFQLCYDSEDKNQEQLGDKCLSLQMLARKLKRQKKNGSIENIRLPIFLQNHYIRKYSIFLPLGKWNKFAGKSKLSNYLITRLPPTSFVFRLPGMRLNWTSRPHQLYQRYMHFYSENLTEEEKQLIERENLRIDKKSGHRGPEWDCFAEMFWKLLQEY